ncbi:MAG TPA: hypothetical protein VMT11_04800 [Myxococcaceae bacterium]|nr:hypothetical protein [Myxococcaceae bacterium]
MSPLPVDPAGSSGACVHVRQHHPGSPERMLPCAWPGCDLGVGEERLSVCRPGLADPLLLERRWLVLGGAEQVFLWHPCGRQS